jgi:hypothetical protein
VEKIKHGFHRKKVPQRAKRLKEKRFRLFGLGIRNWLRAKILFFVFFRKFADKIKRYIFAVRKQTIV